MYKIKSDWIFRKSFFSKARITKEHFFIVIINQVFAWKARYLVLNSILFALLAGDHDTFDLQQDGMYPTGQPLDHEPTMGQVPIVPPGTPPSETWVPPHFNGLPTGPPFMHGRHSPNLPMSQSQMMSPESMPPLIAQGLGPRIPGMPGHDMGVSDGQNYPDYPPVTSQNHVEVYWRHGQTMRRGFDTWKPECCSIWIFKLEAANTMTSQVSYVDMDCGQYQWTTCTRVQPDFENKSGSWAIQERGSTDRTISGHVCS